jgi:hypothetical protein
MHNCLPELNDADIVRLLQTADAATLDDYKSIDAAGLCNAARRRRAKSRRTRVAGAALGAACVVALLTLSNPEISQPIADSTASVDTADELGQVLAALDRDANQRRQVVLALRQSERLANRRAELESLASEPSAAYAVEESSRSAAISLQYAVLIEQQSRDVGQARHEYQRVAQRFPGTLWATVAAESLHRLSSSGPPNAL